MSEVHNPMYPTSAHLKSKGALNVICKRECGQEGKRTEWNFMMKEKSAMQEELSRLKSSASSQQGDFE
eukprot:9501811-Pyramimonas_sp.AAC.2